MPPLFELFVQYSYILLCNICIIFLYLKSNFGPFVVGVHAMINRTDSV